MQPTAERESAAHKISIDLNEFRSAKVPAQLPALNHPRRPGGGVCVCASYRYMDNRGWEQWEHGKCQPLTTHVTYFNSNQIGQLDWNEGGWRLAAELLIVREQSHTRTAFQKHINYILYRYTIYYTYVFVTIVQLRCQRLTPSSLSPQIGHAKHAPSTCAFYERAVKAKDRRIDEYKAMAKGTLHSNHPRSHDSPITQA